MKKRQPTCENTLLSRFLDRETGLDRNGQLKRHLEECAVCRKIFRDYKSLSGVLHKGMEKERSKINFHHLEEKVLARITTKRIPWLTRLQGIFTSRKLLVPAASIAAVIILSLTLTFYFVPSPRPSAIIKSFTGETSSVMIIEIPESRQMIIWYKEISMNGGNEDGSQKITDAGDFVCSDWRLDGISLGRA